MFGHILIPSLTQHYLNIGKAFGPSDKGLHGLRRENQVASNISCFLTQNFPPFGYETSSSSSVGVLCPIKVAAELFLSLVFLSLSSSCLPFERKQAPPIGDGLGLPSNFSVIRLCAYKSRPPAPKTVSPRTSNPE